MIQPTEVLIEINTQPDASETEILRTVHFAIGEMLGVSTPLEKAIKPGGRAHAGLSSKQVEQVKSKAAGRAGQLRTMYEDELLAIVNSYAAAVALADAARDKLGLLAVEYLHTIRASSLRAAQRVIREGYRAQWRAGRDAGGNLLPMDATETKLLQKMYRTQQTFFENMLDDIERGTAKMPLPQRVHLYANCSIEEFWAGMIFADLSPDVYYRWKMADAEHCSDCLMLAHGGRWADTMFAGIYSAQELAHMGVYPGSGKLECTCGCKCTLERVERPRIAPKGDLWNRVVLSKEAKANTSDGKPAVRQHLAKRMLRHRWNFAGRK